jgi:hypothetical protein
LSLEKRRKPKYCVCDVFPLSLSLLVCHHSFMSDNCKRQSSFLSLSLSLFSSLNLLYAFSVSPFLFGVCWPAGSPSVYSGQCPPCSVDSLVCRKGEGMSLHARLYAESISKQPNRYHSCRRDEPTVRKGNFEWANGRGRRYKPKFWLKIKV